MRETLASVTVVEPPLEQIGKQIRRAQNAARERAHREQARATVTSEPARSSTIDEIVDGIPSDVLSQQSRKMMRSGLEACTDGQVLSCIPLYVEIYMGMFKIRESPLDLRLT